MLGVKLTVPEYISRFKDELDRVDPTELETWSQLLYQAWEREHFVYVCGNGGSATTATHITEDLGKSTLPPAALRDETRKRLKIVSLADNLGWILALGNDVGYDQIFVQQLMNYGRPGDLLIAISGSGNSPNILTAVDWANRHSLTTFSLTGFDGGKLRQSAQFGLHVPLDDMGMVESIHLALFHWVLNDVYARINQEGRHGVSASDSRTTVRN
jgi:D-sedoheptulose 7-phosphate isomerase